MVSSLLSSLYATFVPSQRKTPFSCCMYLLHCSTKSNSDPWNGFLSTTCSSPSFILSISPFGWPIFVESFVGALIGKSSPTIFWILYEDQYWAVKLDLWNLIRSFGVVFFYCRSILSRFWGFCAKWCLVVLRVNFSGLVSLGEQGKWPIWIFIKYMLSFFIILVNASLMLDTLFKLICCSLAIWRPYACYWKPSHEFFEGMSWIGPQLAKCQITQQQANCRLTAWNNRPSGYRLIS